MKTIGFRCWNNKFSYVIIEGTQDNPNIIEENHIKLPQSDNRAEQLAWFRKEIKELIDINDFEIAVFKATEPVSRKKDLQRAELEGVLQEIFFSHKKNIPVLGRIKVQLNSKTTSRKPRYLGELFEKDAFSELPKTKYQEAAIAALSGLPM